MKSGVGSTEGGNCGSGVVVVLFGGVVVVLDGVELPFCGGLFDDEAPE